jgi:uncharacterized protein YceK
MRFICIKQQRKMIMKKILATLLLVTIIGMIMSGCSSQVVTSTATVTATITATVTATVTATATTTTSPLQQQAINFVKFHLIELTGATGVSLTVYFDELENFKWSAIAVNDSIHPPYLVSASYIYGSPTDTVGIWLFDPTSGNVTPSDIKAQNAETQVKYLKDTIALVPVK